MSETTTRISLRERAGWLVFALLVAVCDQASKWMAQASLDYQVPVPVTSFLNMTLTYNLGAAFSFLSDAGGWQRWFFALLALTVSVVLVVWLWRLKRGEGVLGAGLALILGGAVGNLWDRVVIGAVVDFIDLHWSGVHWPAFNVADSAITLGAVMFAVYTLRDGQRTDGGRDQD